MIEPCDRPVIFELTHTADLIDWTGDITDIHWRTFMDDLRRTVHGSTDFEVPAASRPAAKPPRPRHEPHPGEEAAPRRPLRPGSDEVISASRKVAEPVATPIAPKAPPPPPSAAPDDGALEVHCLEVEEGDLAGELFAIPAAGAKIGRTPPADIVVAHKTVSREHCQIGIANDELLISDLNSTNGTYVDGERVTRASVLPIGSVLQVGQVSMRHTLLSRAEVQWRSNPGYSPDRVAAAR